MLVHSLLESAVERSTVSTRTHTQLVLSLKSEKLPNPPILFCSHRYAQEDYSLLFQFFYKL